MNEFECMWAVRVKVREEEGDENERTHKKFLPFLSYVVPCLFHFSYDRSVEKQKQHERENITCIH